MTYVLMAVGRDGRVRWALTESPTVPSDWVQPGELGLVLEPLDVVAVHNHVVPEI